MSRAPATAPPPEPLQRDDAWAVFRRLLSYSRRYLGLIGLAVLGMVLDAAATAGFTALMRPLLDEGFVADDWRSIAWLPALVLVIFAGRGLGALLAAYCMNRAGRSVVFDLRADLFERLLELPTPFFDRTAPGSLVAKLTFDVEQVAAASTEAVTTLLRDTLYAIGFVVVMLASSVRLTLFVLLLGPPIAWLARVVGRRFRRYSRRIQDSVGGVADRAGEVIAGQQVVKLFEAQEREAAVFREINARNRRQHLRLVLTKQGASALVHLLAGLALAAIFLYATTALAGEGMTPGTFIAFITAMLALLPPLRRLTDVLARIQTGVAAADSVFRILDEATEKDQGDHPADGISGHVRFENVTLRYPGVSEAALEAVSFEARPGTVTAIVGRSGSGKTSLVNLLPRFYEPTTGRVLVDGIDVRAYRLSDLRGRIAVVSQQIILFNASVADNIAYGRLAGTPREQIEAAVRQAGATEFVAGLPRGLDTDVGAGGIQLSGGQRQRIAIARAFLLDAPILVLDEATSALDSETEREVYRALDTLKRDRTTLVIAHRLSTVEGADQVLVMERGHVVERGTHAELLARDGAYAKLHRMQFAPGDERAR